LDSLQSRHRWICDARLGELAGLLWMTAAKLDGVATSYNLIFRRPVGRHVVLVCDSVSCWVMGQERVLEHLRSRL
jgi:NADH-quinone oxidoreductase subunit E